MGSTLASTETATTLDLNVVLPLLSSVLSFVFAAMVADQWVRRRQPYQLVWTIGLVWFGIAAGTEFLGGVLGWNEALYRTWYLVGAVWVAGWLGLGTAYLLAKTRFGYAFAASILLAGLFTFLTDQRYHYPDSGLAPLIYFLVGLVVASGAVILTFLRDERWVHLAGAVVVGGTVVSAVMMATVQLPAPGFAVDPVTGIPTGDLFPGYIRLLTPFFNITGAFLLVLGALYSAYIFMPKRRVIRYSLDPGQGLVRFLANLAIAPVAIVVNLVASIPGAIVALLGRAPLEPGPGDDPHRHRRAHPGHHRRAQSVRDDQRLLRRPAAGHHLPVPRLPDQHRGLQRHPIAVHADRPGPTRPRVGARRR